MIITIKKLADALNVCDDTARTYIGRWEFSHVDIIKMNGKFILRNITKEDIIRLKELVKNAKKKIGQYGRRRKRIKRNRN